MNKQKILIFSLSAMLFFSLSFIAYSWSEPTTNMPSGYTAPLNTSSTAQTKIGAITVPMVYDYNNTSYYIDPSGNSLFAGKIGIGTTTPNSKLTIGNNVGVGFDEWNDYQLLLYTGATPQASYGLGIKSGTLAFNTNGRFDFDKNGSTMMTINGGNVGIGTTSPQTKLHVNGNIITSRPSNTDHAATKGYVDNQSGGLPTGGTDGAFLRMTSNGPIWDTLLTWIGSTHTVYDCVKIGGTVFDTGTTGTICRLPSETVPSGWRQAGDWSTTVIPTSCTCTGSNCCSGTYTARYICGSFYAGPSSGHQWSNMPIEPEIQRLGTPGGDCLFADCCCCDVYRTILELGIY